MNFTAQRYSTVIIVDRLFSVKYFKRQQTPIGKLKMVSNSGFSGRCFKWQITPEFEALEWMSSSRC